MTLSNALSNALSGIAYASRATEVVASNVANALDPSYARRELQTSSRAYIANGGGVRIDGVAQVLRTGIVAQNRLALADLARADTLFQHAAKMEDLVGTPGTEGSLSATLSQFSDALIGAAARPDNEPQLTRLAQRAVQVTDHLNAMGKAIQASRTDADRAIATDVDALNSGLTRVAALNRMITIETASGGDANALKDQRRALIDRLSQIVPLRELPREAGNIALMTKGGAMLLDGSRPVVIGFEPAGQITPDMTAGVPPLSGLTMDGDAVSAEQSSMFAGGRIDANFSIRDQAAPALQARLDALARDLYDRVADPALDPGRGTAPPLFTDLGASFTPADEVGFANRITVTDAVRPDRARAVWKLRTGVGATTPGPAGDGALLNRLADAMAAQRSSGSATMPAGQRSVSGFAGDIASLAATRRLDSESGHTAAAARQNAFGDALRSDGVNTDSEMERLLSLERAYSANAKVFQAVDDMLSSLLRM